MAFILVLVGYLAGGIPFALLLTRGGGGGRDVRDVGSGNVGATNVLRAMGAPIALSVMVLDIGKGWAAVLFAQRMGASETLVAFVAGSAVLGHVFPVWLRFRGGKGVATACGVFSVLAPYATVVAVTTFGVVVWATRYVSLGSILASVVLPPAVYLWGAPQPVVVSAIGVSALVLYRHRSNVARLQTGSERRLSQRA